jgi:hypothetical protein
VLPSSSSDIGWAKLLSLSMKLLVEVVDKDFFCDHFEWSDFLNCQEGYFKRNDDGYSVLYKSYRHSLIKFSSKLY